MAYLIPFDETGALPTNRRTETQTVSAINGVDHNYVVPDFAPFFKNSVNIYHVESNKYLVQDVDYICTHEFLEAKEKMAAPIYGSLTFLDKNITGTFRLAYQSIGGPFVTSATQAITNGMNALATLQRTSWDNVTVPPTFPPTFHLHPVTDVQGVTEMINELVRIREGLQSQFSHLAMADITDLDSAFVAPLLANFAGVTAAITAQQNNTNLYFTEKTISENTINLGVLKEDQWTDTPLRVTAAKAGTYTVDWGIDARLSGHSIQQRFVYAGSPMPKSAINGVSLPINAGKEIKVQIRAVGGDIATAVISEANRGGFLRITRISN